MARQPVLWRDAVGIRLARSRLSWKLHSSETATLMMPRPTSTLAAIAAVAMLQGGSATLPFGDSRAHAAIDACAGSARAASQACADQTLRRAHSKEVPVEERAPRVAGHPLTAVVVTQCNLLVAVYLTMPDGRLLRYDNSASVPAERLIQMAYTATRSERVEVSCRNRGAAGYERHDPL
jgi:hypothetical protein